MAVTVFSPAKINLYLAVTGRRGDGFHDLVSVAAPLDFGDEVEAGIGEAGVGRPESGKKAGAGQAGGGKRERYTLECDQPEVPVDGTNLILRAAEAFAAATGWKESVHFRLTKRIPLGAGLGGGSSNAVAALRALNQLSGGLLSDVKLAEVAAGVGSDCSLFLHGAPVIMRGRGERVDLLPEKAAARLRGRRVLLFKPGFSISTTWAYQRMAARATDYVPAADAERRLAAWLEGDAPVDHLVCNNMEAVAFEKFVALPVLLGQLRAQGVSARLSGSGSACFALLGDPSAGSGQADAPNVVTRLRQTIAGSWGPPAWVREARIA